MFFFFYFCFHFLFLFCPFNDSIASRRLLNNSLGEAHSSPHFFNFLVYQENLAMGEDQEKGKQLNESLGGALGTRVRVAASLDSCPRAASLSCVEGQKDLMPDSF